MQGFPDSLPRFIMPEGAQVLLDTNLAVIGRKPAEKPLFGSANDSLSGGRKHIEIPDHSASLQHANVIKEGNKVVLRDLGSKNGTFVNGKRAVGAVSLKDKDSVLIGQTVLRFQNPMEERSDAFANVPQPKMSVDFGKIGNPNFSPTPRVPEGNAGSAAKNFKFGDGVTFGSVPDVQGNNLAPMELDGGFSFGTDPQVLEDAFEFGSGFGFAQKEVTEFSFGNVRPEPDSNFAFGSDNTAVDSDVRRDAFANLPPPKQDLGFGNPGFVVAPENAFTFVAAPKDVTSIEGFVGFGSFAEAYNFSGSVKDDATAEDFGGFGDVEAYSFSAAPKSCNADSDWGTLESDGPTSNVRSEAFANSPPKQTASAPNSSEELTSLFSVEKHVIIQDAEHPLRHIPKVTAWSESIRNGRLEELKKQEFSCKDLDVFGDTALGLAVRCGKVEICRYLLEERGAEVGGVCANYGVGTKLSPLALACCVGSAELFIFLLGCGADPGDKFLFNGQTTTLKDSTLWQEKGARLSGILEKFEKEILSVGSSNDELEKMRLVVKLREERKELDQSLVALKSGMEAVVEAEKKKDTLLFELGDASLQQLVRDLNDAESDLTFTNIPRREELRKKTCEESVLVLSRAQHVLKSGFELFELVDSLLTASDVVDREPLGGDIVHVKPVEKESFGAKSEHLTLLQAKSSEAVCEYLRVQALLGRWIGVELGVTTENLQSESLSYDVLRKRSWQTRNLVALAGDIEGQALVEYFSTTRKTVLPLRNQLKLVHTTWKSQLSRLLRLVDTVEKRYRELTEVLQLGANKDVLLDKMQTAWSKYDLMKKQVAIASKDPENEYEPTCLDCDGDGTLVCVSCSSTYCGDCFQKSHQRGNKAKHTSLPLLVGEKSVFKLAESCLAHQRKEVDEIVTAVRRLKKGGYPEVQVTLAKEYLLEGIPAFSGSDLDDLEGKEPIAKGGYASVYLVDVVGLGQVAVKQVIGHSDLVKKEAEVLWRVRHPKIVRLVGLCLDRNSLVLEYVEGGALDALLYASSSGVPLPAARGLPIFNDVLTAVEFIHRNNLVHGDVKSANVLVTPMGAKLSDFGNSFQQNQTVQFLSTLPGFTYRWTSPERLQGDVPTKASDMYAVGCLLLEILTGKLPYFEFEDLVLAKIIMDRPPTIPACPWKELIVLCTQKEPAKRPTAAEVLKRVLMPCHVCFGEFPVAQGISCSQSTHFYCNQCLCKKVEVALKNENDIFEDSHLECGGQCQGIFSCSDLAVVLPNALCQSWTEAGVSKTYKQQLIHCKRQIQDLEDEKKMQPVMFHYNFICSRILTLSCPRCGLAFKDFNGCFALSCYTEERYAFEKRPKEDEICRAKFCGWCNEDCAKDAHNHVRTCPYKLSRDKNFYGTVEQFEEATRILQRRKVAEYLERIKDKDLSAQVLEKLKAEKRVE